MAAQAEAARDVFECGPAEHRQAVVEAVGAQLVKLRAVSAVVHRADQDAISLTLERLELLDVEQEPAVAFEQHDLALAALPARGRDAKRIREAVADRAELADRRVALRRPADHLGGEISLMAAADDNVPILRHHRIDGGDHRARIELPGREVELHCVRRLGCDAMRELLRADGRGRRLAGAERLVETGEDRLDADQRIGFHIEVGSFEPIAQAARRIVELDLVGFWPEVPAADVIGEAGPDREHDVRGLVDLPAQRREVAAGDAEPERMVVEQAARGQRVGEQRAAAIGELDRRVARAGPQHAAAAEDDRPLRGSEPLDRFGNQLRIGMHAAHLGLIHLRRLVGLVRHVFDLLQVVGNAQHHRTALDLGDVEGLAHVIHHARHAVRRDVTRAGRRDERRLVDRLVVELGVDRRLAGEHHQRQARAHRGGQRRHQLGHAGAAGDRGNGELAGRHVVRRRRRDGRVLVPDVDGVHAGQFGEGGAPMHVAVAHQDELRVDPLGKECFGEGFVEFGHGRVLLGCEVIRYATMPGAGQSIRLKRIGATSSYVRQRRVAV